MFCLWNGYKFNTFFDLFRIYIQFLPRYILVLFLQNKLHVLKVPVKINASATYRWTKCIFQERPTNGFVRNPFEDGAERSTALWAEHKPGCALSHHFSSGFIPFSRKSEIHPHGSRCFQLNGKHSSSLDFLFFVFCCISCPRKEDDI